MDLAAIVALLDNLPEDVLQAAGLTQARLSLKKMSKLPRAEKVRELLLKLQDLAVKRAGPAALLGQTAQLAIHRVTAVLGNGAAALKEGDLPLAVVNITGDTTAEHAAQTYFDEHPEEDKAQWVVMILEPDNQLTGICADTLARVCLSRLALVRKGVA